MIAVVTGGRGQGGQLMIKLLRSKGYTIISVVRETTQTSLSSVEFHDCSHFEIYVDLYDGYSVLSFFRAVAAKAETFVKSDFAKYPIEIYHLMCEKQGILSYEDPRTSIESSFQTTLNVLESIRSLKEETKCCFAMVFAGSSEMFGDAQSSPQNELTEFSPKSPYAVGKVLASKVCTLYRELFKIRASTCILYNHESNLRCIRFVSRKIIRPAANYMLNKTSEILWVGNLSSQRDWSHAYDIIQGLHLALSYEDTQDFILAMGEPHMVREFISVAFKVVGVNIVWKGSGLNEVGIEKRTNSIIVKVEPTLFRENAEMPCLFGDIRKATSLLGWKKKYNFEGMVETMVLEEIKNISHHAQ